MNGLFSNGLRSFLIAGTCVLFWFSISPGSCWSQIPTPDDAPRPLTPQESLKHFRVAQGFRLELVSAEPVIREPSGVCWDEWGRLFVTELHGFNQEGQFDIDELNKTNELDRIPRRVSASDEAKRAAQAETYGTVKLLLDQDKDGYYESSEIWADKIPPCYGACPALGGIIVCCAPDILFLADRDGDNRPEVREVLFSGLPSGLLERGVNNPQWGPDSWIYFGRGNGASVVTGPHLAKPVELPHTDFKIKPDGTAIEPVVGATHTIGFAFTGLGDRFVTTTRSPAIWVAPLNWETLQRNPFVPMSGVDYDAAGYQQVYPASKPHPWRIQRSKDPGFSKFYTDRYGVAESAPNGYFTSGCSPLVYQDSQIPQLYGHLLACEPAQNLIHRTLISQEGDRMVARRSLDEAKSEFLTSTDPWFHPIALSAAPDGSIFISDFYREIIEDYSAVPRYLQQIYGVVNGKDRGRIWRLTHETLPQNQSSNMFGLSETELARECIGEIQWRRETARRLLIERKATAVIPWLTDAILTQSHAEAIVNGLVTVQELTAMESDATIAKRLLRKMLLHERPEIRRLAIRLAESYPHDSDLTVDVLSHIHDEPLVRRQLAASIGSFEHPRTLSTLVELARLYGNELYIAPSILSSSTQHSSEMLTELLQEPSELGQARNILQGLAQTIGGQRSVEKIHGALDSIVRCNTPQLSALCLAGISQGVARSQNQIDEPLKFSEEFVANLAELTKHSNRGVRDSSRKLLLALRLETDADRRQRIALALEQLGNVSVSTAQQLDAVEQLADDYSAETSSVMIRSLSRSTPQVREAILSALLSGNDRVSALLEAIESNQLPRSTLSALQKSTLTESKNVKIRDRARKLFAASSSTDPELLKSYAQALEHPRDLQHGLQVFRDRCATCHRAHGIGSSVGPDLTAEFQRAEEAMVHDLLAPSESITAGYVSYVIVTNAGQTLSGLLSAETPTNVTLRQADGKIAEVLRTEIDEMRASAVSMMPDDLAKLVTPKDFADIVGWLRQPTDNLILLDENQEILSELQEGDGQLHFFSGDAISGQLSLEVTPLQKSNAHMRNWEFPIREHPKTGEFRYLRFSWKGLDAEGAMLELAANGKWPPAEKAIRRYYAGKNSTNWQAVEVSPDVPREWTTVTRDLWEESGGFTLTGIAPTAMGGAVRFDRIELLKSAQQSDQTSQWLPQSIDLRPQFRRLGLTQRSQGSRGTCSVFVTVETVEFALAQVQGKGQALSVEFANWAANNSTGRKDDGDFFHNIIRGIEAHGLCLENDLPYEPTFRGETPSHEIILRAKSVCDGSKLSFHWLRNWKSDPGLKDEDVLAIKRVLASGFPVAAGSYHSVLFVGYEDSVDKPGEGRFLISDSNLQEKEISYEKAKSRFNDLFWVEATKPK